MTNHSVSTDIVKAEASYEIDLLNKATGVTFPKVAVYGNNTLGQLLAEYAADIGINPNDSKVLFENKRTGATTSDKNETVSGLGLTENDILAVSDNARVA